MVGAMIHRQTHPEFVEGCFACKIACVTVAPSANTSREGGADAAIKNDMERRWSKDHAAYRRLVKDGLQPKTLDGAAALEQRANTRAEVEHGLGAPKEISDAA